MIDIRTPSDEEILEIIKDPEMYDRIASDSDPALEDFNFVRFGDWLGGYIDGEIASLYWVHDFNEVHFMVKKQHRKHARELYKQSQKQWGLPVFCKIPLCYKTTINFSKKVGFVAVKKDKKSFAKDGKLYDEIIMELKQ